MDWKAKLSSRKLWAAVAGVVIGVAVIFGVDEGLVSTIAGALTSVVSLVAYIITEGKVDAEAVANTIGVVKDAVEELADAEDGSLEFLPEDDSEEAPVADGE